MPDRRRFGSTDLMVSPLCLGTNVFGWTCDEETSFAVLDAYVGAGGNFLDTATYGHILRGGLGALKECISGSDSPSLPEKIERTFVQIEAILSRRPERLILMNNMVKSPFVAASDAALEGGIGTGGFLIDVLGHSKTGAYMTMGREVFDMWQPGDRKIAQLELLMVLDTFLSAAHVMRGRRGVFFIDNIAALMSLVRGSSRNEDLDAPPVRYTFVTRRSG